jgi:hypothetical protein
MDRLGECSNAHPRPVFIPGIDIIHFSCRGYAISGTSPARVWLKSSFYPRHPRHIPGASPVLNFLSPRQSGVIRESRAANDPSAPTLWGTPSPSSHRVIVRTERPDRADNSATVQPSRARAARICPAVGIAEGRSRAQKRGQRMGRPPEINVGTEGRDPAATGGGCYACRTGVQRRRRKEQDFPAVTRPLAR